MRLDLTAPRPRRRISLTPLIDVVFMLLLFFLLASQFDQWRAFTLTASVPSSAGVSDDPARTVLLHVQADGRLALDGTALDPARLVEVLREQRQRDPDLTVVLQADAEVELQALVTAMDGIAAAGIRHTRLQ